MFVLMLMEGHSQGHRFWFKGRTKANVYVTPTLRITCNHTQYSGRHEYLAGSDERVEERAEQSNAFIQLKRFLVFTEVRCQLNAQRLQLRDVTLQLRQLVSGKLFSATASTVSRSLQLESTQRVQTSARDYSLFCNVTHY